MLNKKSPQWVLWKPEKRAGKLTKIPYSINKQRASSTDPSTWHTYAKVSEIQAKNPEFGIGFVLPSDKTHVAVDIDHCLKDGKITTKLFQNFVDKSDTYTEISPSGDGLHLFFYVEEGFDVEANRSKKCPGFECYSTGRYLTYTENIFGEKKSIRVVTPEEMTELLSTVGYPWKDEKTQTTQPEVRLTLSANEILQRMFSSKNGEKIRKLYEGDISEYAEDYSAADMAFCMHLAFWTQKDAERMLTIWLHSPLGQREKTQKRTDYQNMTVQHAIQATAEVYSPTDPNNIVETFGLMVNPKGAPYINLVNINKVIENDELLSSSIRRNAFSEEDETNLGSKYSDEKEWRPVSRADVSFITRHIQSTYPFFEKVSITAVAEAVMLYAYEHPVNEVYDWITSLEWDGDHRLDHWLHYLFGVEDNEYYSAIGANWFMGMAKRIVEPGCQMDHMIVIEGPQGIGKSTSLKIIGRGYHTETILDPNNKDFQMLLKRNVIVEFSEGYTMSRADSRVLKSIITMREDQFRVPFGMTPERFKRRCVFAMTTNEDTYLRDETGNRRFWPVKVEKQADIEWLEQNLDQLYAEAYHRAVVEKEKYWEYPEDEAKAMQEARMVENPYVERLINWYASIPVEERQQGITAFDAHKMVWLEGVSLGKEMNPAQTMQVTGQLSSTLKLKKNRTMRQGDRAMRWFPTKETEEIIKNVDVNPQMQYDQEVNRAYKDF